MSSGNSGTGPKPTTDSGDFEHERGERRPRYGTWSIRGLEGLVGVALLSVFAYQASNFAGGGAVSFARFSDRLAPRAADTSLHTSSGRAPAQDRLSEATIGRVRHRGEAVPVTRADLWLARCMYAETNRPREQELVAWIVRNRVETRFRGRGTYRGVVTDSAQFSPFNPGAPRRAFYLRLRPISNAPGWRQALLLAREVRRAPPDARPFPVETRHFYSQRSMQGQLPPSWAVGHRPVVPQRPYRVNPKRFRFFANLPADS